MKPALSEEQRQAVREQPDRPVEVVDPATNRTYVLISQEMFEQIRSPLQVVDPATNRTYVLLAQEMFEQFRSPVQPAATPEKAADPGPTTPSCGPVPPLRQRLKDLPTPPEVADEVARLSRKHGYWWKSQKRKLEETLKLKYYYGGQCVAYQNTKEGMIIVAAGPRDSEVFDRQIAFLTPEERSRTTRVFPSRLDEPDSIL